MVIFSWQPQNRRFVYSLSGKDSTYFEIDPSSGLLKINATLDYEQEKFNYSFEVSTCAGTVLKVWNIQEAFQFKIAISTSLFGRLSTFLCSFFLINYFHFYTARTKKLGKSVLLPV